MDIHNASSIGSSGNPSLVAGAADRSSAWAAIGDKRSAAVAAKASPQPATVGDQVTISEEAQNKLKAETAGTANADAPSDIKKFAYGALGLDRPTAESAALPNDSFTYGRWASAALTTAAIVSVLI
ncbi:hypothetical protein [Rhodoferax sp. GW822-FHT02A01]|uniref:hypothetical protein n=1 Tax=Rhodoferax sp. GW822-FHT02A01 TaxID=3141537 RepID=UPI00315DE224